MDFLPGWHLSGYEESFYQLSLTANDHAVKSLKPFAFRDLRLCIEPVDHKGKLLPGNVAMLDAIEQMRIQMLGQIPASNPWHISIAVKPACHGGF